MLYIAIENNSISNVLCAIDDTGIRNLLPDAAIETVSDIFDDHKGESVNSFLIDSCNLFQYSLLNSHQL